MPRPVTMPKANDKRRRPERTDAIRILKPAISNIPKSVSAMVAAHANDTFDGLGKRDVTAPVYSTKRAKFPQDTFFAPYGPHKPKRSATAPCEQTDNLCPFSLSCAAFEFIRAYTFGPPQPGASGSSNVFQFRVLPLHIRWRGPKIKRDLLATPFQYLFLMPRLAAPCLSSGRETHASTTQSDPLLLPTRNGTCREDGALHREYLFYRVQHPPP